MSEGILRVRGLRTSFPVAGARVPVVDGLDLDLAAGEVLALVGESGCGKSVTALSLLRLVPRPGLIEAKEISLCGQDVLGLPVKEMRGIRGKLASMIFQEPMTSLNPVQTVGDQVIEAIRLHERVSQAAARARVVELFESVRIPDAADRVDAYPHQLSGGLKQRVMIAMALSLRPKLLIADEPTTALDVTIQAQILELMRELQRESDTAILLITHDLGVVNELADRIAVMYAGRVVEEGSRETVLGGARHPYTQGLLRSIPSLAVRGERLAEIAGVVPRPEEWPAGCRFSTRCSRVEDRCRTEMPELLPLEQDHTSRCLVVAEEAPR
jgi:peptide/nickel transport system ATP-binding protein